MRKNIATYLALFSLLFVAASCKDDNQIIGDVSGTHYAYVTAFNIDNIKCPFHDVTAMGEDTIVEKIVSGDEFEFVINHAAKEIYNIDSLTFGTKVNKVVSYISCVGVPYRYVAAEDSYVYYNSSDSVDFTSPVNVCIASTDGTYESYYTIKLNVHQVDPNLMVWEKFVDATLEGVTPAKLLEKGDKLYLFGTSSAGDIVVAESSLQGSPVWGVVAASLPAGSDLSSILLFGDKFYVLAQGDVYASADALSWEVVSSGAGFVSLFSVSDNGSKLWAADASNIYSSVDGESFQQVQSLPEGFPLYGNNFINSTLTTNANIHRTILIGYATAEKTGDVKVWCRLSNGSGWFEYSLGNNEYTCPSFGGLAVLGYDDAMFAFGGATKFGGVQLNSFDKFYISRDNGVVWKECNDYGVSLPAELKGADEAFAAAVSQNEYMWIVTPTAVWKGRINRLGFK